MLNSLLALSAITLAAAATGDDPPRSKPTAPLPKATVLVVVGTPGTAEYAATNTTAVQHWREAAARVGAEFISIGEGSESSPTNSATDHNRLRDQLARLATTTPEVPQGPLWLVLLGHGSFDGREAKFNLRGPDVADVELAQWLKPIARPVAVFDCTSASAPFLSKLAGPDRIVVTATKSGGEQNYARFGQYLAEVWTDPATDLDKDGQTSLLEGFLIAARRTGDFYKGKARLSTEHPLIDDNADGRGTPADWFEGVRLVRKPQDATLADGRRAHLWHLIPNDHDRTATAEQLQRRAELEASAATLQDKKTTLDEAEYYRQFEGLMIELARTYAEPSNNAQLPAERKP